MAGALKFWNGEEDIIIGGSNVLGSGAVKTGNIANGAVTKEKLADDAKSKGVAVILPTSGWVDNAQTVVVEGVTADNNVIVGAASASREAWNDAEIYCSAQGAGSLTFTCGSVPAESITANVVILV